MSQAANRRGEVTARAKLLRPLRGVFDWMLSLRDDQGRIICPEHQVEHGGKNAGMIVMALVLARYESQAARADLVEVALQQGMRLVDNLVREGTSPCFTFRPGRHDPFNCSNSVIDGGAASDALGFLVRELEAERSAEELKPFGDASLKHARTYLRYAVLDKGIPAQRAWGLTGLASAFRIEDDSVLLEAALSAVDLLAEIQHEDGSYPYHPLQWGAAHAGASDVSAYYQSRVTAFIIHALTDLGRDPAAREFNGQIRSGLDYLAALHGPDGVKVGLVEAKPWYWGATYEVASHPFDVFALAEGWRLFGDERYSSAAMAAFDSWVAHMEANGAPSSHHGGHGRGRSYQCPVFWAGHAMWIARALPLLEDIASRSAPRPCAAPLVQYFPQASLLRLENDELVAWVRGARPAVNVAHGSPHGAGLIRVVRKADGMELVARCRLGGHQAAEWSGKSGLPSPVRGLRAGAKEVRFSTWISRVHWRAGRKKEALCAPLKTFKRGVLAFAHSRVSSAFCLSPTVELIENGVRLRSSLAWRDGTPVPESRLLREFLVDETGLLVREELLDSGGARALSYPIPEGADEIHRSATEIRYRLS
ncbi:MAG: hypothetical protein ACI8X5_003623 [Planctomycetota bacterium]|jgi:hypothetical protein